MVGSGSCNFVATVGGRSRSQVAGGRVGVGCWLQVAGCLLLAACYVAACVPLVTVAVKFYEPQPLFESLFIS